MGNQSLVALRHMVGVRVEGPEGEKPSALAEGVVTSRQSSTYTRQRRIYKEKL